MSLIFAPDELRAPAALHQPASAVTSSAQDAIDLALAVGLELDLWQQMVLGVAMGERADGKWAAFEFGLCVPRRNGKTHLVVARMLAGLFLFDEKLQVYSAHQFKTAMDTYNTLREVIKANPQLMAKVRAMPDANGKEGIYFHGEYKARLLITARGKKAVRGFGADTVYYDEAMDLPRAAVSAMMPTVSRTPNGQIWYIGSAVDQEEMENGDVFADKRRAGHAESPKLAWVEYAAEGTIDDYDPFDEDQIYAANPGLGLHDWTMEDIENEQPRDGAGMSRRGYAVERMGIGDWPEPEQAEDSQIPAATWKDLAKGPDSVIWTPVAVAVDIAPNRHHASVAVAGANLTGEIQVEIVADGSGTSWILGVVTELVLAHDPVAVVIDSTSALQSKLADEGIEATVVGATEVAQACGGFYDDATAGTLAHLGDPMLRDALKDSGTRNLGNGWAWDRRGSRPITPLVAATLAHYGFVKHYKPPKQTVIPQRSLSGGNQHAATTDDLARAGF